MLEGKTWLILMCLSLTLLVFRTKSIVMPTSPLVGGGFWKPGAHNLLEPATLEFQSLLVQIISFSIEATALVTMADALCFERNSRINHLLLKI
jgi:hypothetical protein